MTKAIGVILTITGLLLAVTFVQVAMATSLTTIPLPYFLVLAIAVAMISVGIRYILKGMAKKTKPKPTDAPES